MSHCKHASWVDSHWHPLPRSLTAPTAALFDRMGESCRLRKGSLIIDSPCERPVRSTSLAGRQLSCHYRGTYIAHQYFVYSLMIPLV